MEAVGVLRGAAFVDVTGPKFDAISLMTSFKRLESAVLGSGDATTTLISRIEDNPPNISPKKERSTVSDGTILAIVGDGDFVIIPSRLESMSSTTAGSLEVGKARFESTFSNPENMSTRRPVGADVGRETPLNNPDRRFETSSGA